MKKILVATMVAVMGLALASDVMAGANPLSHLAVWAQANNGKRTCATDIVSSCSAIQQSEATAGYVDLLIVLYDFEGATGIEYGLSWTVPYFTSWTNCTDLYVFVPTGANSADVSQTWTTCEVGGGIGGPGVVLGWANMYGAGRMDIGITSFPNDPQIVDCTFQRDVVHTTHPGFTGGGLPGPEDLTPCQVGPTATESTTWGQLKDLYR